MDALTKQLQTPQAPAFLLAGPQDQQNQFDFWGILSRRKWLVFLGLLTGLALGGLFNANTEPIFVSEAKVQIEPRKKIPVQITGTTPVVPLSEDFEMRHDRLIGEYNIVDKCFKENKLGSLESFAHLKDDEIVPAIMENIYAKPDREERTLYEIKFYWRNQNDVATILNLLIATYKQELNAEYELESQRYKDLLERVSTVYRNEYQRKTAELRQVNEMMDVPIIGGAGITVHHKAIADLPITMEQAQANLQNWNDLLIKTRRALDDGPEAASAFYYILVQAEHLKDFGSNVDSVLNERYQFEIQRLVGELQDRLTRLGPGHPDVTSLNKRIAEMKKAFSENQSDNPLVVQDPMISLSRFLVMLQQRIEIEQSVLIRLATDYQRHYEQAQRIDQTRMVIKGLEEEIELAKGHLSAIEKKVIEADPNMDVNASGRNEGFNFRVISPASRGNQSWPILPLILAIGGLLGTMGGFGIGCLIELADKTFHNPDEIVKQLNVPLIGHIPIISQSKRYLVENSVIEPVVCSFHRPKSQVSEAFRAVRTSLYFNTQGKQSSVIQITSPTPGDGKSTLAANLAVSIAQSGKRVLLVDGDMRRPRQATTFGITSKTGFATVLSGESDWRDVLYECAEIEGLTIMPCGAKPNNPAELTSSPQVKELIEELRQEFDFVIIDSPPLLAVTDACPIAARVDGVILCIRIKKNVRISAERATEMLANLGANCIGLVVNGVGAQSGYGSQYTYGAYRAGYSYNGYGYGYGYGYGAGKYYEDDRNSTKGENGKPVNRIEDKRAEQPPVSQ